MSKLTEEDIKLRFITPAIVEQAHWAKEQISMEYFTCGQVIVQGRKVKRGSAKKADYLLFNQNRNIPLAVVEAKDKAHSLGSGMQQAMEYAQLLDVPFAYSSNGKGFLEHDFFTGKERELALHEFPTEADLWQRYRQGKALSPAQEHAVNEPFHYSVFSDKEPRYYQRIAINRTVEAIVGGQKRGLLVMATGTGKTYTAFQIIWKLLQAKAIKRVLYLADRNILIDQTMQQDFKPFEKVMCKVQNKSLDSSYEVYMSLYQQLVGEPGQEPYLSFKPEFFDLVVVDECHRGSAAADSQWRQILDYFSSAIHLGMTATPKENKDVSNISYFGEPIYTYSLKQGISDGFLAPYKVLRVGLDRDLEGWRPTDGQRDVYGEVIEDREYNIKDFDRNLIIDERTKVVARRITAWLQANDPLSKTIVFCVDIDHAERLRQALVNENALLVKQNPKYVMRITGDTPEGKAQLDYFIDPGEKYPAVVTTSKLLTTGVDAKTVKLIVLDTNINSITEFKQIIGRGTRLYPAEDKHYFTIMDFRDATRLFADPDFDGNPVVVADWGQDTETPPADEGEIDPPEGGLDGGDDTGGPEVLIDGGNDSDDMKRPKYRVRGVDVQIISERAHYIDPQTGKLITENLRDYTKRNILGEYATLDMFIAAWSKSAKKQAIVEALTEQGVFLHELREQSGKTAQDMDDFDLIMHVAYDKKPLTKHERVNQVKKRGYLHKYSADCQQVLSALLDKYMDQGISELEDTRVLENEPFSQLGSPAKIAKLFGGREAYLQAVKGLENNLYFAA